MNAPKNWRLLAACAHPELDPEVMFPDSDKQAIDEARAVCEACPVRTACLTAAMAEEGDWQKDRRHGVRGGLTGPQRAYRYRGQQNGAQLVVKPPAPTASVLRPNAERSPQNMFTDHTVHVTDGHLVWAGPPTVWIRGRSCSPKRLAFVVGRGRDPQGRVLGTCGYSDCVLPAHIADDVERRRCGTRAGYQWHQKQGTEACAACRQANADADNRLRHTGTTKALV